MASRAKFSRTTGTFRLRWSRTAWPGITTVQQGISPCRGGTRSTKGRPRVVAGQGADPALGISEAVVEYRVLLAFRHGVPFFIDTVAHTSKLHRWLLVAGAA